MEGKLIKESDGRFSLRVNNILFGMVTLYDPYSGQSSIHKLSLTNCINIKNDYDLDKIATEFCEKTKNLDVVYSNGLYYGFVAGFDKRDEMLSDKKFSEQDVLEISWELFRDNPNIKKFADFKECFKEHIELLEAKENEIDVIIDTEISLIGQCDCLCHKEGVQIRHIAPCCNPKMVETPKFDADGFLMLKRK